MVVYWNIASKVGWRFETRGNVDPFEGYHCDQYWQVDTRGGQHIQRYRVDEA